MCNENRENCLTDILELICRLQCREEKCDNLEGCDRPYLGPQLGSSLANTRPVNLYHCNDAALWTMDYVNGADTGTSSVFRVESVDRDCATFRVLIPNPDATTVDTTPYIATPTFFTLNTSCASAIKCLQDTFVPGV